MTKFTIEDLRDIAYRGSYDDLERELALQLLASMEQTPVYLRPFGDDGETFVACDADDERAIPLYAAPQLPQPAVVDEWRMMCGEWRDETVSIHDASGLIVSGISPNAAGIIIEAHNACRTAMLQGAEPVQGWIPCSERMPEKYDFDIWVFSPGEGVQHSYGLHGGIGEFSDVEMYSTINDVTHWMPMSSPAAPQQEVKP